MKNDARDQEYKILQLNNFAVKEECSQSCFKKPDLRLRLKVNGLACKKQKKRTILEETQRGQSFETKKEYNEYTANSVMVKMVIKISVNGYYTELINKYVTICK